MNRSARKGNIPTKKVSTKVKKVGLKGGKVRSIGVGRKRGKASGRRRESITGTLDKATRRNRRKPKGKRIPSWLVDKTKKSIKTHF